MKSVLGYTAHQFGRALIMPNTAPPITKVGQASTYRRQIKKALKDIGFSKTFEPLMTLYLTDKTTVAEIEKAAKSGFVKAVKYYPPNATTNSQNGATDLQKLKPVFEKMQELGLVLCLHGETIKSNIFGDSTRQGKVGVMQREKVFLAEKLTWLVSGFPKLKIVLEHITTKEAVYFVKNARKGVAATITAHHLLATIDDVIESHHNKCMPILKEEADRQALLDAATSGNKRFFAGTDSAPHSKTKKETACGCAGCFTAPLAIELYAEAFDERDAWDKLEGFMSLYGADFYGLSRNKSTVTITRQKTVIPQSVTYGEKELVVLFWAEKELSFLATFD
jgi:dihydroorotase